jgi:hypothetical protein
MPGHALPALPSHALTRLHCLAVPSLFLLEASAHFHWYMSDVSGRFVSGFALMLTSNKKASVCWLG